VLVIIRLAIIAVASLLVGACQTTGVGSVGGGECKIFERPQYVVLGKRPYDQDWIDSQVEGGIGGCGWQRPKARPPALDAVPGQKVKAPPPAKKRGLIKRMKDRVWKPRVAPVIELPAIITQGPSPVPAMPPPDPPRDPVDELLRVKP
jgi:hypothetical protein